MNQSPTTASIREARSAAGFTQFEAGKLVHVSRRTWQAWERGETHMPLGLWELFGIKSAVAGSLK